MNIKKILPKFMVIGGALFWFAHAGHIAVASEGMKVEINKENYPLIQKLILQKNTVFPSTITNIAVDFKEKNETQELYKFKIFYQCLAPENTTKLKSLSIETSDHRQYETQHCKSGMQWSFGEYNTNDYDVLLSLKMNQLPFTLTLRWLSWYCTLDSLRDHFGNSCTPIPLHACRSWRGIPPLTLVINKNDLFNKNGVEKVSTIIIESPTHGSSETKLKFI